MFDLQNRIDKYALNICILIGCSIGTCFFPAADLHKFSSFALWAEKKYLGEGASNADWVPVHECCNEKRVERSLAQTSSLLWGDGGVSHTRNRLASVGLNEPFAYDKKDTTAARIASGNFLGWQRFFLDNEAAGSQYDHCKLLPNVFDIKRDLWRSPFDWNFIGHGGKDYGPLYGNEGAFGYFCGFSGGAGGNMSRPSVRTATPAKAKVPTARRRVQIATILSGSAVLKARNGQQKLSQHRARTMLALNLRGFGSPLAAAFFSMVASCSPLPCSKVDP